ncbi:MAG: NAD(P)/FAD-dependent oxidoreductase [Pseudodonghicola sp.]
MQSYDTIVVGAGIAGLTAAHRLQQEGKKVLVLEASDRPGGRIMRISRNDDMAEAGGQGIHSNYAGMFDLIRQFGLQGDVRQVGGPLQFTDRSGRKRIIKRNMDMLKMVGVRGMLESAYFKTKYQTFGKKFAPFELLDDVPAYDNAIASEAFSGYSRNFRDYILGPLIYSQANTAPTETNLYYLANALRLKMTTKTYGLLNANATLTEAMAGTMEVRYETPASRVLTTNGVVDGVELSDGTAVKARHVILACTAGVAGHVLGEEFPELTGFLSGFTHTPIFLVYSFLDRPLQGNVGAYMRVPENDLIFRMAIDHSKYAPHLVPSGKGLISSWSSYPDSKDYHRLTDAEIIAKAHADMAHFIPNIANWTEEARVVRHNWGITRFGAGMHRKVLDFKERAARIPTLSFAGTDYNSIHMESGVISGHRAAERALAAM